MNIWRYVNSNLINADFSVLRFSLISLLTIYVLTFNNCYAQYQLKNKLDYPLVGSAIVLGAGTYLLNSNINSHDSISLKSLNKEEIFVIDKYLMADYHSNIAEISDYFLLFNMTVPLTLLTDKNINNEPLKFGLMYFETISITASLTGFVKNIAARTRPFVYGKNAGNDMKMNKDARQSFFSGHTSWSFASAVFLSSIFSKLNPNSEYNTLIWGTSLLMATSTGILRIVAGKHYFTDVLTGAVVGSFVGWLVPYLHESNLNEASKFSEINSIKVFELKYGVY